MLGDEGDGVIGVGVAAARDLLPEMTLYRRQAVGVPLLSFGVHLCPSVRCGSVGDGAGSIGPGITTRPAQRSVGGGEAVSVHRIRGNRALIDNAYYQSCANPEASDMSALDPDRFTLRQVDEAQEAYAQLMEELDLIKEQLARLPTRNEVSWIALRLTGGALAAVVVALLLIR